MKSLHGPVALFWNTTSCSWFGARVQAGGVAFRGFAGAWLKAPVIFLEGIKAGAMEQLCLVGEGGPAGIQPMTPVLLHVYKAGDFLSPN